VPLLLDPLQLCFKVLLRFSSHGPIPFSRWQVLRDGAGAIVAGWRTRTPGRYYTPLSPTVNTTCVRVPAAPHAPSAGRSRHAEMIQL
jgi:hypothetical protein